MKKEYRSALTHTPSAPPVAPEPAVKNEDRLQLEILAELIAMHKDLVRFMNLVTR